MRFLVIAALAAALATPGLVMAQDALDPKPMTWHGVQLGAEQVFEGDYTVNFETSTFRLDGAPAADTVWLSGWEDRPGDNGGITRRYHLRFLGRQTVEPGRYGSLGVYRHTVLITHLISARVLIGASPEPPVRRP
jgi:hypothetical protein